MPNTNYLINMRCPNCGSEGPFDIACTVMFTVNDDGYEDHGDLEWNNESYCACIICSNFGTVQDFKVKETPHA